MTIEQLHKTPQARTCSSDAPGTHLSRTLLACPVLLAIIAVPGIILIPCVRAEPAELVQTSTTTRPTAGEGEEPDAKSVQAFFHMISYGSIEAIREVLQDRPELAEAPNNKGLRPLHYAAQRGRADVARALVELKADVNATDPTGRTPLHWAAHHGREDVAGVLLEAGANANARSLEYKDHSSATPLHEAAACTYAKHGGAQRAVAECLLAYGADPTSKDGRGRTAAQIARVPKRPAFADWLEGVRSKPRSAFRRVAPEASCQVSPLFDDEAEEEGTYRWRLTREWPVQVIHGVYTVVDGLVEQMDGYLADSIDHGDACQIGIDATLHGQVLSVITAVEWSERGTPGMKSGGPGYEVPAGAQLVSESFSDVRRLGQIYTPLWRGRLVKDGKTVKELVYAARVINRGEPIEAFKPDIVPATSPELAAKWASAAGQAHNGLRLITDVLPEIHQGERIVTMRAILENVGQGPVKIFKGRDYYHRATSWSVTSEDGERLAPAMMPIQTAVPSNFEGEILVLAPQERLLVSVEKCRLLQPEDRRKLNGKANPWRPGRYQITCTHRQATDRVFDHSAHYFLKHGPRIEGLWTGEIRTATVSLSIEPGEPSR